MKKTLIAFAALSAIAGMAQAQSTVTIYGLLDGNINNAKTNVIAGTTNIQSQSQGRIDAGGLNGSRWGIRVSEDLGGGLAAVGNIESGFALDTGASSQGALFGRRANVGLSGGFGTVTIGRNSSSYDDVSGDHAMMEQTMFDPSNVNNGVSALSVAAIVPLLASSPTNIVPVTAGMLPALASGSTSNGIQAAGLLSRNTAWVGYSTRFNNSIKYISPNFGGFTASLMYALGEDKTTTLGASRTISANVKYANGPLVVSGGYQSEGTGGSIATGVNGNAKPRLDNTLLSASYDFGVAKLGLGLNRATYKDLGVFAPGGGSVSLASQNEYNISVAVPVGAAVISAGYARSRGNDLGTASGLGIQALYSLSKRTTLYAGAQSTKQFDSLAADVLRASPVNNIGNVTQYGLGMRHKF